MLDSQRIYKGEKELGQVRRKLTRLEFCLMYSDETTPDELRVAFTALLAETMALGERIAP